MYRLMLTSSGGSPANGIIRSLRESSLKFWITGLDANNYTIHRSEADESFLIPYGSDKNFILVLNDLITKTKPDLLHCQNSSEMVYISKLRDEIGVKTFLPSKESIEICSDKFLSYEKWKKSNVNVPKTYLINNYDDLEKAFNEFNNDVWIRATTGSAGRGSIPTKNISEAKNWIDSYNGWGSFTAAERLREDSVTWMSIWKDGELIVAQGRKRHYWEFANRAPSGVTGITGLGSTFSDKELDELAIKSIKAIDNKPNGIWSVDMTYDHENIPNLTEINIGRFFTTVYFYTKAGCNFPEIYMKCALDLPLNFEYPMINPCKPNQYWLRGMDFLPILIQPENFDSYKNEFEKRKKDLGVS